MSSGEIWELARAHGEWRLGIQRRTTCKAFTQNASSGFWLEMQNLRPHPRPGDSESSELA